MTAEHDISRSNDQAAEMDMDGTSGTTAIGAGNTTLRSIFQAMMTEFAREEQPAFTVTERLHRSQFYNENGEWINKLCKPSVVDQEDLAPMIKKALTKETVKLLHLEDRDKLQMWVKAYGTHEQLEWFNQGTADAIIIRKKIPVEDFDVAEHIMQVLRTIESIENKIPAYESHKLMQRLINLAIYIDVTSQALRSALMRTYTLEDDMI